MGCDSTAAIALVQVIDHHQEVIGARKAEIRRLKRLMRDMSDAVL